MKYTFNVQKMGTVWSYKYENRKKVSWQFFTSVFMLFLRYLMRWMISKWSKFYVAYLYMWIKYKSITVYISNRKGGGGYIKASKGIFLFKYVKE